MNKQKSKIIHSRAWVILNILMTAALIIGEIISDSVISDSSISNDVRNSVTGWVSFGAFATFVISGFTLFKTRGWIKTIPLVCAFVALIIFCLAFFAYGFSGYGSTH